MLYQASSNSAQYRLMWDQVVIQNNFWKTFYPLSARKKKNAVKSILKSYLFILFPNPFPLGQDMTQGQFLNGV